jgi:hypothetical protein
MGESARLSTALRQDARARLDSQEVAARQRIISALDLRVRTAAAALRCQVVISTAPVLRDTSSRRTARQHIPTDANPILACTVLAPLRHSATSRARVMMAMRDASVMRFRRRHPPAQHHRFTHSLELLLEP